MTISKVTFNPTVIIIHFNNHNRDVTVQLSDDQSHDSDNNNVFIPKLTTSTMDIAIRSIGSYQSLTEEIHDTLRKIQSNPVNPTHYIRAGELYSCQGNQQESISICEIGLRNIPSSMVERLVLLQQLNMAQERLKRQIDFLSQAPYEIAMNIIGQLDSKAAIQCIDVARSWRQIVLNHTGIWKKLILHEGTAIAGKNKGKIIQLFSIMSTHVEVLLIHAKPGKIKRLLGLLNSYDFPNLKSLKVYDSGDGTINAEMGLSKTFCSILPRLSATLTNLEIASQSFIDLSLGRILSHCPKLTTLKFNIYSLDGYATDRDIPSTKTELTRLDIVFHYPNNVDPFRSVLHILLHWMPKLQHFRLFYNCRFFIDDEDIMLVIQNQCRHLTYIKTGSFDSDNPIEWMGQEDGIDEVEDYLMDDESTAAPMLFTANSENNTAAAEAIDIENNNDKNHHGLECLVLHNIHSAAHIRMRLEHSQHTLRKLSLKLSIAGTQYNEQEWDALAAFTMTRLTTFHLSCSNESRNIYRRLSSILRCFPVLKHLSLSDAEVNMDYPVTKNIMNAIGEMSHLTKIEFSHFQVVGSIQGFFDRLMYQFMLISQQEEGKGLKEICIADCSGFTSSAMQHVTGMKSLKKFTMIASDQIILESDVEDFTKRLVTEPTSSLEILELGNIPLTDQAVENIIDCKWQRNTLKTVTLNRVRGLSRQSMRLLEYHIENLSIIV